jgi:hypothetical protein
MEVGLTGLGGVGHGFLRVVGRVHEGHRWFNSGVWPIQRSSVILVGGQITGRAGPMG